MKPSIINQHDGTLLVSFNLNRCRFEVVLKLNVSKLQFQEVSVTKDGEEIWSDERHVATTHAAREVFALLHQWLEPPPEFGPRVTLAERIELSFAVTLHELSDAQRSAITPLDASDMTTLQTLANTISWRLRETNIQASSEKRHVPGNTFNDIKGEVLKDWQTVTLTSERRRNFYSSVLGRAFAWKGGRIPYAHYVQATKLLPGIKLML